MVNRPQEFKSHHITRGLKAALKAGVQNPQVSVRLPNGSVLSVGGSDTKLPRDMAPRPPAKPAKAPVPTRSSRPAR
jgi:hypothetical protein